MRKITILAGFPALASVVSFLYFATEALPQGTAANQTKSIVTATTAFLNSLSPEQREKILFPFVLEKTATAAKFARTDGGRGPGGPGAGGNGPGGGARGPGDPGRGGGGSGGDRKGPGGGPGGGAGFGFVGEQYGKAVWSNYPVSDVPRPGLTLGSLSPAQRESETHMMQVLLSAKGYQKVLETMGSDQA